MKKNFAFNKAARCGARTKHNNGNPCRCPAVRGKNRCRIHGGAKGSGGQVLNKNALKHGLTTAVVKNFRKTVRKAIREGRNLEADFSGFQN